MLPVDFIETKDLEQTQVYVKTPVQGEKPQC